MKRGIEPTGRDPLEVEARQDSGVDDYGFPNELPLLRMALRRDPAIDLVVVLSF